MTFYADQLATAPHRAATPQTAPMPMAPRMVANRAGGHAFAVDRWVRLQRFLVLGTEAPTYYVTPKELTARAAPVLRQCLREDGRRVVREIVVISTTGRAPKNDPALFALAVAASSSDPATVAAAYAALPAVARTGAHLFQFVDALDAVGTWNAAAKRGIAAWYQQRPAEALAYQLLKYRARAGWSHRDVLRLGHVRPVSPAQSALFRYVARGERTEGVPLPELFEAAAALHAAPDVATACSLLARHPSLTWEMMPTQLQREPAVWDELLPRLGVTALLRKLGQLSAVGLLCGESAAERVVLQRLADTAALRRARVHPVALLSAWRQYGLGHGAAGRLRWQPVASVLAALEDAFHTSFHGLPTTGRRFVVGVDCSGSMYGSAVAGLPGLTSAEAAAVVAMAIVRREPNSWLGCFDTKMRDLPIRPDMRLGEVLTTMQGLPWGGTDCAQPMLHATSCRWRDVDGFVVLTDNETWAGAMHPAQALARYRHRFDRASRLVVCATVANEYSIADPDDAGMLDIAGFDAAVPELIQRFGMTEEPRGPHEPEQEEDVAPDVDAS